MTAEGRAAYEAWWRTAEGVPASPDVTYDQDAGAWDAAAQAVLDDFPLAVRAARERDEARAQLAEAAAELTGVRAHASSLAEDLDDAALAIEDYRNALGAMQRERDAARAVAAEMCDDIEHVISGNHGYIDQGMLDDYRERAGIGVATGEMFVVIDWDSGEKTTVQEASRG